MFKALKKPTILLVLSLSVFFFTPSHATTSDDSFVLGKHQLKKGDFDKAYDLLFLAFLNDPANPDINFFLGKASFEKGDFESALMAYERILIMHPGADRIKLEIARCHMALGANESAKQFLYEVLAANPPEAVKANIDLFLAAIAAKEQKHFFSGVVAIGFDVDDNIQVSPSSSTILGIPVTILGNAFLAEKDEILSSTVMANHIYKINDLWSWKTTILNYNSWYENHTDLDLNYYGLSTGPVVQKNNWTAEFNVYHNKLNLDYDRYTQISGFGTTGNYLGGPHFLMTASSRLEKKRYQTLSSSDATNIQAKLSPSYITGEHRLSLSLLFETENSDTEIKSYDRSTWEIRYDKQCAKYISGLFASFSEEKTNYDGKVSNADSPSVDVDRSDTIHRLTLGVSKTLWRSKNQRNAVSTQISHTYTESKSNVLLYTYRKNLTSSLLSYVF